MWNRIRIRNKIAQVFYRPKRSCCVFPLFSEDILASLCEIESGIERRITPLLSDFF
jgi:hypothetical protein